MQWVGTWMSCDVTLRGGVCYNMQQLLSHAAFAGQFYYHRKGREESHFNTAETRELGLFTTLKCYYKSRKYFFNSFLKWCLLVSWISFLWLQHPSFSCCNFVHHHIGTTTTKSSYTKKILYIYRWNSAQQHQHQKLVWTYNSLVGETLRIFPRLWVEMTTSVYFQGK